MQEVIERLALADVLPDPDQDRQVFDSEELELLAGSILKDGQLAAGIVVPLPEGKYRIVAGERRYRAVCLLAERGQGPGYYLAAVKDLTEEQALNVQLLENLNRVNLSPLQEARCFDRRLAKGQDVRQEAQQAARRRLVELRPALTAKGLRVIGVDVRQEG